MASAQCAVIIITVIIVVVIIINIVTIIIIITYIQKAYEFADSTFEAKRICGKSASILTTKFHDKSA